MVVQEPNKLLMKITLALALFFFSLNLHAQEDIDKIVTVSRQACDCISNIDTALDKDEKGKEIKACITSANIQYQIKQNLLKTTEKIKDTLNKSKEIDSLIIDSDSFDLVITDSDYKEIEEYLYDNCGNMRDLYFSDDIKLKNSISDKDKAIEYYNKGIVAFDDQDYKKAIEYYKKAVKVDKKFAFAWDNLGLSYRYTENFEKAIECYEKSLKIDPKGRLPMLNIAITYEYLKDYDKAIKAYKKYGRIHKNDPESFYGLGRIYSTQENYEEGLDNMIQAYLLYIELDSPYKIDAERNIAYMYQELEKQGRLEVFDKLAKKYKLQVTD